MGWLCFILVTLVSCGGGSQTRQYRVAARHPHDPLAFTQGLVIAPDRRLIESTGLVGESTLRIVDAVSGTVIAKVDLAPNVFGEGTAIHGHEIVVLTWRNGVAFRFDRETLEPLGTYRYDGEGWGLAGDGKYLYRSDGTSRICVHDPDGFKVISEFRVLENGKSVGLLNELEFVRGELWANVWKSERIVRIDPRTGTVIGWVDLSGLYPKAERPPTADVLNGIAWDSRTGRVLVTGKRWPWLYELEIR